PQLPYVANDLARMRHALGLMGVPPGNIESHGSGIEGSRELSTARMQTIIRRFLDGAAAGEDLLIYFSGHGIEQEGHRLLVPQDYDLSYPMRASEMISDVNIFTWARRSKADSVLVLLDACRVGVRLEPAPEEAETKSLVLKSVSEVLVSSNETPTIAIVF